MKLYLVGCMLAGRRLGFHIFDESELEMCWRNFLGFTGRRHRKRKLLAACSGREAPRHKFLRSHPVSRNYPG